MSKERIKKRIFISACEPSGDVHCANLIKAVKRRVDSNAALSNWQWCRFDIDWAGVGGENMSSAGCELIENTVDRAAMIYNAFAQVGFYRSLLKRIDRYFRENHVDLLVVCDSPAFNFHVAKIAKKNGVRVLFYVAPQLWAWAPWRIGKLRRLCDRLACILPFEQDWFTARGVDAVFVGNPLFDRTDSDINLTCKDYSDYNPSAVRLALMPGSRLAEVKTLWPAMQTIAAAIKKDRPATQIAVSAFNQAKLDMLKKMQIPDFECNYKICDVPGLARWADLSLVASGSATLQVAAAGCPMVIMYQSNRLLWHLLGRWLIRTKHLSLVNILAGRPLVPEFMPYFTCEASVYNRCSTLLDDRDELVSISRELKNLIEPLAAGNASEKVACMVLDILEGN